MSTDAEAFANQLLDLHSEGRRLQIELNTAVTETTANLAQGQAELRDVVGKIAGVLQAASGRFDEIEARLDALEARLGS